MNLFKPMITTATQNDWEDFWHSSEIDETWKLKDLENVWNEMEKIEPLTPNISKDH